MLLKILGIFDLIAAFIIFSISFGLDILHGVIIFFVVVLFIKGAFVITKSLTSAFDVLGAIVLILSFYFTLPHFVYFIAGFLILQKGIFSLL